MTFNNDTLTKALDFWDCRQPVEAGRSLFEAIKPSERAKWAVAVLRLAQERSTLVSQSIQHLLRISDDSGNWPLAKQVFSTLRAEVLKLERLQTLTDAQEEGILCLYLAENVAKVLYNATNPPDEFDEDSGWWVAGCLRRYVDHLNDDEFTRKAWTTLATAPE